jgi:hypothetical protein
LIVILSKENVMKLDIETLRTMILEEAAKMQGSNQENLQEIFRAAGGIGFGEMRSLVQDEPKQPSLTPPQHSIIQNDDEHAVKELYEAALHMAQIHGVDPREALLKAAELLDSRN